MCRGVLWWRKRSKVWTAIDFYMWVSEHSLFNAEHISARLWMRNLFSQCTYIRVCYAQECQFALTEDLMHHVHWLTRIPSDGGLGRTAFLENGGWVGQRRWTSATYVYFAESSTERSRRLVALRKRKWWSENAIKESTLWRVFPSQV